MILLLGPIIFAVLLSLIYGWVMEFVAIRSFQLNDDHDTQFSITILLGIALLSGLLGFWSFYGGMAVRGLVVFSILALLAAVGLRKYVLTRVVIIWRQVKSIGILSWLIFVLFLTYILYLASIARPQHPDTGLYHAQAIRWIETYGTVPGLANLHVRLGFNSTMFLLAAFWGFAAFGLHYYQVPSIIIMAVLMIYCLSLMQRPLVERSIEPSAIIALGLIFYILYQRTFTTWVDSPAADMPSAVITWMVFLLFLNKFETGHLNLMDLSTVAICVLCCLDLTIKLSALPLFILPVYLLWKERASFTSARIVALVTMVGIVLLPWVVRNVMLTGYLLFPFRQLDIFRFDWKVPAETVAHLTEVITAWGRSPHQKADVVISASFSQWVPDWYKNRLPPDLLLINSIIVCFLMLVLILAIQVGWKVQIIPQKQLNPLAYISAAVGILFWFLQAPDPRFGYGFLVLALLLFFAPLVISLCRLLRLSSRWLIWFFQSLLVVLFILYLGQIPSKSWARYRRSVNPYPVAATTAASLGSQVILVPREGGLCWYAAFPCTPIIAPGLSMRGSKIQDGFYIRGK